MNNLITANFNDVQVLFQDNAYLNATIIAKSFNKIPKDYLKTDRTKQYIDALFKTLNSNRTKILFDKNQIVTVRNGSSINGGGTWLHPKLAIDFARWLSPEFAVWCDEQIEKILTNRSLTTKADRVPLNDAVNMLVAKTGNLMYPDAYKMVHQYMGVKHTHEIPLDDLDKAIEYVHGLVLRTASKQIEQEDRDPMLKLLDDETTSKIISYMWDLNQEIIRLGGKSPDYPDFDEETIVKAVVTRMIQGSRMMLSIGFRDQLGIKLIPKNAKMVHDDNIATIISDPCGISKQKLPDIMNAVLKRASR